MPRPTHAGFSKLSLQAYRQPIQRESLGLSRADALRDLLGSVVFTRAHVNRNGFASACDQLLDLPHQRRHADPLLSHRQATFAAQKNFILLYVICGILGSVVPGTLYFYAASQVSAGVLSITIATVPLATFVGAAIFKIEKASLLRVVGVLFGIGSIALLVLPDTSMPDPSAALWVLVMVIAAACYAIENLVIAARMPTNVNVFVVVTGMLIAATIMLTPVLWITDTFTWISWPLDRSGWAIVMMAGINASAYGGFYYLVVRAGPVFASQCVCRYARRGAMGNIDLWGSPLDMGLGVTGGHDHCAFTGKTPG